MLPLLLASCAYDAPLDASGDPVLNTITGQVSTSGISAPADTLVLLFDADDPPPPSGTGSPVLFAAVPGSSFEGGNGAQGAPFLLSEIPAGTWLISALMDTDGDFHPLLSSNAGATCGDFAGGYVSSVSDLTPATLTVSGGEVVSGVDVMVYSEYTTERPAFTMVEDTISQSSNLPRFTIAPTGIHSSLVELADPGQDCGVQLIAHFIDSDNDGVPDPHPIYGALSDFAYDSWPQIYLQYLGDDLEEGESWASVALLSPFMSEHLGLGGTIEPGVPTAVDEMEILFLGGGIHFLPDGTEETVYAPDLPNGAWSVTLVMSTGQTWTLPNEVAGFTSTSGSFDVMTQAGTLIIEP